MRPMNVCMISAYPPQRGGVAVHAESLALQLSKRHRLFVITYGRLGRKPRQNIEFLEVPVPGIGFLRGLAFAAGALFRLWRLTKRQRIQVVHSQYMHPAGLVPLVFRRLSGRRFRIVVTAHGSDVLVLGSGFLGRRLVRFIGNSCDRLICVSGYLASRAEAAGIRKAKIRVIPNGISDEGLPGAGRAAARRRLRLPAGRRVVLFAGSLTEAKGADVFVVLARHLSGKRHDLQFVLVGDGPERRNLEDYCRRSGISGIVRFAGQKDHRTALEYIRAADVLVVPSRVEGFGLTALEGMRMGVPVAASPNGALPGLLSGQSVSGNLPSTVMKLLGDGKFRKAVVEENIRRSRAFDWRLVARETERDYVASRH